MTAPFEKLRTTKDSNLQRTAYLHTIAFSVKLQTPLNHEAGIQVNPGNAKEPFKTWRKRKQATPDMIFKQSSSLKTTEHQMS